jgi:flagella basal body P-ring formation protein FlgA
MINTSMTRNSILMSKTLQSPLLVTQGNPVKVTLHHHGITLVTDAIALGEGSLGQIILMKNPNTQQTFAARISGFQQAEAMP